MKIFQYFRLRRFAALAAVCALVCGLCSGCLMEELLGLSERPSVPKHPQAETTAPTTEETTLSTVDPTGETEELTVIKYGIVTKESVDVWTKPDSESGKADSLPQGTRIAVYKVENNWVRIDQGWVKFNDVYIDGNEGDNYAGFCTVTADAVNLREGPSTDDAIVDGLNTGDQVLVLEQVCLDSLWWGCTNNGWVCMSYVYVDGTMDEDYGIITVTGDIVNLRSGPGTGYEVTDSLKRGDKTQVYKILTVAGRKWGCTDNGWICMDYVKYDPM